MDSLLTVMPKDDLQKRVDAIDSLGMAYGWVDQSTIEDIRIVTADFLIANIDSAFSKWESTPWGKHLTFEMFCETLLPYKAEELQPLDGWRGYMPDSLPLDTKFLYCDQFKITFKDVPQGGLYLLRDLTRGKDERIFTYENGEQVWW